MVNELSFCVDCYAGDDVAMWNDIRDTLKILTKNDYEAQVYCDCASRGVYIIKYDFRGDEYARHRLCWLSNDEYIGKEHELYPGEDEIEI